MRDATREILSKMSPGKTLDVLSREMNMRESTIRAIVDSMLYIGYLQEIRCGSGCSMCPMKCNSTAPDSGIKIYTVTDKGMECVNGAQMIL